MFQKVIYIQEIIKSNYSPIQRPILVMIFSHSFAYFITIFLHSALYLSIPIFSTSSGPLMPRVLSISNSIGRPWQSHPNRLST